MAQIWDSIVDQLRSFPGDSISLRTASSWDEGQGEGLITISLVTGSVYESCKLQVLLVVGKLHTQILLQDSVEKDHPEGVVEASTAASNAVTSSGPESVRSAILRLCDELCIELDAKESDALKILGRSAGPCAKSSGTAVPAPPTLKKEISVATSHSFESDDFAMADGYRESSSSVEGLSQERKPAPKTDCRTEWAPTVEDAVAWSGAVVGLKKISGQLLDLHSAGTWDGKEGILDIELHSRDDSFDWQHLRIVLIAGARRTSIELKGAQAIRETVRHAVRGANDTCAWGNGPLSVGPALIALCSALCVELHELERNALQVLGDRAAMVKHLIQNASDGASVGPQDLFFEMKAVEALKTQLGLIKYQIQHVETRMMDGSCPQLQHELDRLKYSEGEVSAEMRAAGAAVEAALLQSTETSGSPKMTVNVHIEQRPSQSLRGHGVKTAETTIRNALSSSGPWAHYAAHQFSAMLSREQDLDDEFICLYHSYSLSAVLYEVQAVIARQIYGLSSDLPPVPRLSTVEPGTCRTLTALKGLGGKDANPSFQALGLSSSCSIFASGSEAPPLTCFQGGYSASNPVFLSLLVKMLKKCGGSEETAKAVQEVANKNGIGDSASGARLTGYMLQIFIHKSICENYAYPSKPYGVVLPGTIQGYLGHTGKKTADGQARILFDPVVFLDPSKVRLFHYCARPLQSCMDAEVPGSRGALIRDLRAILEPLFLKMPQQDLAANFQGPPPVGEKVSMKPISSSGKRR